jgi:hypothetical protein
MAYARFLYLLKALDLAVRQLYVRSKPQGLRFQEFKIKPPSRTTVAVRASVVASRLEGQ